MLLTQDKASQLNLVRLYGIDPGQSMQCAPAAEFLGPVGTKTCGGVQYCFVKYTSSMCNNVSNEVLSIAHAMLLNIPQKPINTIFLYIWLSLRSTIYIMIRIAHI